MGAPPDPSGIDAGERSWSRRVALPAGRLPEAMVRPSCACEVLGQFHPARACEARTGTSSAGLVKLLSVLEPPSRPMCRAAMLPTVRRTGAPRIGQPHHVPIAEPIDQGVGIGENLVPTRKKMARVGCGPNGLCSTAQVPMRPSSETRARSLLWVATDPCHSAGQAGAARRSRASCLKIRATCTMARFRASASLVTGGSRLPRRA